MLFPATTNNKRKQKLENKNRKDLDLEFLLFYTIYKYFVSLRIIVTYSALQKEKRNYPYGGKKNVRSNQLSSFSFGLVTAMCN